MVSQYLDKLFGYFTEIYSSFIIKLTVFVVIILIGFIIGKIVGKIIFKLLNEMGINDYFRRATGIKASPDNIISKSTIYLIDFVAIIIALDAIDFSPTLIYGVSASLVVIVIFSIIIGIKDIVPNVVAGLFLFRRRRFHIGEDITIGSHTGKIIQITLTETVIKKKNKSLIFVPNSEFIRETIIKK